MIICDGNKNHDLDYDVTRHWIHLKGVGLKVVVHPVYAGKHANTYWQFLRFFST